MPVLTSVDSLAGPPTSQTSTCQSDMECGKRLLVDHEDVVLTMVDAPFDGSKPQDPITFRFDDDLDGRLNNLLIPTPGTARIFDVTVHSDFVITGIRNAKGPEKTRPARHTLMRYLQSTYTQPLEERKIFRWLNDPLDDRSQDQLHRLVNRMSLQQHPLDFDVQPRDSYMTCAGYSNDRLIVIIVHDVWHRQQFNTTKSHENGIMFRNPRNIAAMLDQTSCTSLSDGSLHTFAKLLVPDFFLTSIYLQPVDYYEALIYPEMPEKGLLQISMTGNPHLQVPLGLFEPRLSTSSREAFKEIEDAEGILRNVANLKDSIKFVLKCLELDDLTERKRAISNDLQRRIREIRELCDEQGNNASRALEALNRQLDYLSKRHTIQEAKSIKILTILASVYLPLSSSASLLSMKSPFKVVAAIKGTDEVDITGTNLLFDFVGLFVTLGSITICIVRVIKIVLYRRTNGLKMIFKKMSDPFSIFSYGRKWRFGGKKGTRFMMIRKFSNWWIYVGLLVTLLVIFLVGMLMTAKEAWNAARALFAVYIGVGGLSVIMHISVYWYWHRQINT